MVNCVLRTEVMLKQMPLCEGYEYKVAGLLAQNVSHGFQLRQQTVAYLGVEERGRQWETVS